MHAIREHPPTARRPKLTLLGLVETIQDCTDDEVECVATLRHLIGSGRARFEDTTTAVAEILAGGPAISLANHVGVCRRDVDE